MHLPLLIQLYSRGFKMSNSNDDYQQVMYFIFDAIDQLNELKSLIHKQLKNNRHANERAYLILARTSLIVSNCFTRISYMTMNSESK